MAARRAIGVFASRMTSTRRHKEADAWKRVTCSCLSTAAGSDASSFVAVEASHERARLKAAALAAQAQADSGAMYVFDRTVKAAHRDRAAYLRKIHPSGDTADPFLEEIARRTLDRLSDVKREFPRVLVLGGAGDAVVRRLLRDRGDVRVIVVTDMSRDMLRLVRDNVAAEFSAGGGGGGDDKGYDSLDSQVVRTASGGEVTVHYVHADEEELPAKSQSVDVVVSALGLHWANDLPAP